MQRFAKLWKGGALVAAGIVVGAIWSSSPAGGIATQDPAVTMQIQQHVNNLRFELQHRFDAMQVEIDTVERELQNLRFRVDNEQMSPLRRPVPTPSDPIPGMITNGRLVSEVAQSGRFVLQGAGGVLAQLSMTADGPGLVIYDVEGQIAAALVATATGPQLRMRDADGNLATVLTGRQ